MKFVNSQFLKLTVFYTFVTFLMFYPLSTKIFSHIHDNYDSLFLLWELSWYKHALFNGPFSSVLNSNILYPDSLTLAYSTLLISKVPIFLLFDFLTSSPLAAYNLTIAFSFVLAAVAFFYLSHYLTKNIPVSIIGGILYSFSPIKIGHLSLAQMLNFEYLPLSMLFCEKYFKSKRLRDLLLFLLFSSIQLLSEGYVAIIFSVTFAVYLALRFHKRLLNKKFIFGGVVTLILVSTFYWPYIYLSYSRSSIFKKELLSSIALSLNPASFHQISGDLSASFISKNLKLNKSNYPDTTAYFGIIPIVLLIIYIVKVSHKQKFIWLTILIFTLSLSFGPYYFLSNGHPVKLPYYYLWKIFPFLSQIRSPGRFSLIAIWPLSIISVITLVYLYKNLHKRILKSVLSLSILFIFISDNLFLPFPNQKIVSIPQVYSKINAFPPGPIFEFPFRTADDFLIDKYNYFSTANFYPIVMAYSSNYSDTFRYFKYLELNNLLFTIMVPEKLKDIKVKYVFVHEDKLTSSETKSFLFNLEKYKYQQIDKVNSTYIYSRSDF